MITAQNARMTRDLVRMDSGFSGGGERDTEDSAIAGFDASPDVSDETSFFTAPAFLPIVRSCSAAEQWAWGWPGI